MSYQKLIEQVAKEHNTTPSEVDMEIRAAIRKTGFDIEPELFIASCVAKIKKDYMS